MALWVINYYAKLQDGESENIIEDTQYYETKDCKITKTDMEMLKKYLIDKYNFIDITFKGIYRSG